MRVRVCVFIFVAHQGSQRGTTKYIMRAVPPTKKSMLLYEYNLSKP